MLSCKQASRLISQSLDRPLSWRERFSLRLHLVLCDMCTQFRHQLYTMRMAVRKLTRRIEQDESLVLPQQARARIAESISAGH